MGVSVLGCLLNGFIIIQATHGQIQVLDGLYISGKEIVNICTANIKMGVKLREADRACPVKHAEHRLDTKVYKGVDYKDEPEEVDCPTGMEILAEASKTKAGDVCVLRKIGWVDMNLSPIEKTIESDIVSLPIHVLQAVTGRDYWSCIDRRVVVKKYIAFLCSFSSLHL